MMANDNDLRFFVEQFKPHFFEWIFKPINRLVYSEDALIGFIFMSCVIDYLAGFWWGEGTNSNVKKAYTGFVKQYFPVGVYDAYDLYDSLRNGLVHMFTIKGKRYALIHNRPDLHLKMDSNNQTILNAGDFAQDLYQATLKYFSDVETDFELLKKFMKRYKRDGFLFTKSLEVP